MLLTQCWDMLSNWLSHVKSLWCLYSATWNSSNFILSNMIQYVYVIICLYTYEILTMFILPYNIRCWLDWTITINIDPIRPFQTRPNLGCRTNSTFDDGFPRHLQCFQPFFGTCYSGFSHSTRHFPAMWHGPCPGRFPRNAFWASPESGSSASGLGPGWYPSRIPSRIPKSYMVYGCFFPQNMVTIHIM